MASHCHITGAIDKYVRDLINLPVNYPLDGILENALSAEKEIRLLFGTDPYNPVLQNSYLGLIDIFSLHPAARRTRARNVQIDTRRVYEHYVFPLGRSQRRSDLMPSTVPNIQSFQAHWSIFSHGALSKMRDEDWENVVVAGGSVLACLMASNPQITSSQALNDYFLSKTYVHTVHMHMRAVSM